MLIKLYDAIKSSWCDLARISLTRYVESWYGLATQAKQNGTFGCRFSFPQLSEA